MISIEGDTIYDNGDDYENDTGNDNPRDNCSCSGEMDCNHCVCMAPEEDDSSYENEQLSREIDTGIDEYSSGTTFIRKSGKYYLYRDSSDCPSESDTYYIVHNKQIVWKDMFYVAEYLAEGGLMAAKQQQREEALKKLAELSAKVKQ